MRITKRQLRRIIKEEKVRLLNEQLGTERHITNADLEDLRIVYFNLDDLAGTLEGLDPELAVDVRTQMELMKPLLQKAGLNL
jgi:hypothetical protein